MMRMIDLRKAHSEDGPRWGASDKFALHECRNMSIWPGNVTTSLHKKCRTMRHQREQHPASRSQTSPGPRCVTHFHLASSPMSQTHPASLPQTTSPRTPNKDQPDQQTRSSLPCFEYLCASSDRLIIDDIPACCQAMPQRMAETDFGQTTFPGCWCSGPRCFEYLLCVFGTTHHWRHPCDLPVLSSNATTNLPHNEWGTMPHSCRSVQGKLVLWFTEPTQGVSHREHASRRTVLSLVNITLIEVEIFSDAHNNGSYWLDNMFTGKSKADTLGRNCRQQHPKEQLKIMI